MGRRRPGALFEDADPDAERPESAVDVPETVLSQEERSPAQDVRTPYRFAPAPEKPAKKERTPEELAAARERKAARLAAKDPDETPRDEARRLTKDRLRNLLKFFNDVASGKKIPTKAQMDANSALLEIALDKTPTAQPVTSKRNRILVGFAGGPGVYAGPGRYPGGSSVLKEETDPKEATDG